MSANDFVIRVYGIYFDHEKGLLVSDELIQGKKITKFPGGGLEYGEGTIDCLKRELKEETGDDFEIVSHFYTTDFFVPSAFHEKKQVISIYYKVRLIGKTKFRVSKIPFDFKDSLDGGVLSLSKGAQSFRFIEKDKIDEDQFTLVIDQHVGGAFEGEAFKRIN